MSATRKRSCRSSAGLISNPAPSTPALKRRRKKLPVEQRVKRPLTGCNKKSRLCGYDHRLSSRTSRHQFSPHLADAGASIFWRMAIAPIMVFSMISPGGVRSLKNSPPVGRNDPERRLPNAPLKRLSKVSGREADITSLRCNNSLGAGQYMLKFFGH